MSADDNLILARRFFNECWNKGQVDMIDEILAPNHIHHLPGTDLHGPKRVKELIQTMRTAFPDLLLTIDDEIAAGDKVVLRWTICGTNTGELFGNPPTGNPVVFTGIEIFRCENGRIVELWNQADYAGYEQQLNK